MAEFACQTCPPELWPEALGLLYLDLPWEDRKQFIEGAIARAKNGLVQFDGLLICRNDAQTVGALLSLEAPGRTVMLWSPRVLPTVVAGERDRVMALLLAEMIKFARAKHARVAQVLLADNEQSGTPALLSAGFFDLTRLIYLKRSVDAQTVPEPPSEIAYETYAADRHREFLDSLEQSYVGSQDTPELSGLRTMEEVFEGHRAQGQFRPEHWFLLRQAGRVAGVLLLAGLPDYNALEVAYLGLIPAFRGRGLGRELTRQAIRVAQQAKVEWLTLAVDIRNEPARRIYDAEDFQPWDERQAYLLVLDPHDGRMNRRIP